jgi:protein SCO1/2
VGLTGTPEQIRQAAKAYRVSFGKAGNRDLDDYLMGSTFICLMAPDGGYLRHFGHAAVPEEIAAGIEAASAEA